MQLPDAIDVIRPAVVQMRVEVNDQSEILGTGFLVSEQGHVVTALHVVDAVDMAAGEKLIAMFSIPDVDLPGNIRIQGAFTGLPTTVLATNRRDDLALLQVPIHHIRETAPIHANGEDLFAIARPVAMATSVPREGTEIAISGYPLAARALVTTSGTMASLKSNDGTGANRFLGDITANGGNSGGPVYVVEDATLVGVLVAGQMAPILAGQGYAAAGLALIVPLDRVTALLESAGVAT